MIDREKVINCLIDIENIMIARQDICPREELQYWIELQEGVADAIALMNEQEAVIPKRMHHNERASFDNYLCECKNDLYYEQKYCDECGRSVKWE